MKFCTVVFSVVFLISLLTSCRTLITYNWKKTREESESIRFIKVQDSDKTCRELGLKGSVLFVFSACAHWTPEVCTVYSEYEENEIPEDIKEHEILHCRGYSHN